MQTLQPAALGDNQVAAMKEPECQVVPLQKTTSREVGELEATKSPRDMVERTSHVSLPSPESFAHFSHEWGDLPPPKKNKQTNKQTKQNQTNQNKTKQNKNKSNYTKQSNI